MIRSATAWACLLALLPVGTPFAPPAPAPAAQAIRMTLPNVRSGDAVHIGAGHQPTLVVVFATWCRTCRSELPLLDSLRSELHNNGVALVALNADDGPNSRIVRWLDAHEVQFTVVRDTTGAAHRHLGVVGVPEAYLVDEKGVIRWSRRGPLRSRIAELQQVLSR